MKLTLNNLTLDLSNFEKINVNFREFMEQQANKIETYLKNFQATKQEFLSILDNEKMLSDIENFAKNIENKFERIVVLGMGGSALGAKVLANLPKQKKFTVVDSLDENFIEKITKNWDWDKTLFFSISKSGMTAETLALTENFAKNYSKQNIRENLVILTENEQSLLGKFAKEFDCKLIKISENISGRYSVLTEVGLLPAVCAGIKIREIIAGAKNSRENFNSLDWSQNLALCLAGAQVFSKKNIQVLFSYNEILNNFNNWWCQLLAESTGKNDSGFTPISLAGVRDQHSILQLLLDGPKDKLTIFFREKIKANSSNLAKLLNAEFQATKQCLQEKTRENLELEIGEFNETVLGELFVFFECATFFICEMLELDCFTQNAVERGKEIVRSLQQ